MHEENSFALPSESELRQWKEVKREEGGGLLAVITFER
jgi:hypothetical protein